MTVFLANRANLQRRRLHDRIKNRLRAEFTDVQRRRAVPREPGAYRVVGEVNPRAFLGDEEYPETAARLEVGFRLRTGGEYEHYWINWIEPERALLVGWHQDDTHEELGPVHLQVNDGGTAVAREPAHFLDSHPLDVVSRRIDELEDAVSAVEWNDGRPVGLNSQRSE